MKYVWLVLPQVQTADLGLADVIASAKGAAVPMLGLRQNMLTARIVKIVRGAGFGIGGWACNDAEAIEKLLALQVDVFTTDRPDLAIAQRRSRTTISHYDHPESEAASVSKGVLPPFETRPTGPLR